MLSRPRSLSNRRDVRFAVSEGVETYLRISQYVIALAEKMIACRVVVAELPPTSAVEVNVPCGVVTTSVVARCVDAS